jgi:hypothetical protein
VRGAGAEPLDRGVAFPELHVAGEPGADLEQVPALAPRGEGLAAPLEEGRARGGSPPVHHLEPPDQRQEVGLLGGRRRGACDLGDGLLHAVGLRQRTPGRALPLQRLLGARAVPLGLEPGPAAGGREREDVDPPRRQARHHHRHEDRLREMPPGGGEPDHRADARSEEQPHAHCGDRCGDGGGGGAQPSQSPSRDHGGQQEDAGRPPGGPRHDDRREACPDQAGRVQGGRERVVSAPPQAVPDGGADAPDGQHAVDHRRRPHAEHGAEGGARDEGRSVVRGAVGRLLIPDAGLGGEG